MTTNVACVTIVIMADTSTTPTLPDDPRWSSSVIRDLLAQARRPDVISMAGGLPANELLPRERIGDASTEILTTKGDHSLQYGLSAGEPELRDAIADRSPRQGATADNILVTAGSQQALDLVARFFATPGATPLVAMDDPGYLGAVQIFQANGYELLGVPVDADGMDVAKLDDYLSGGGTVPTLVYTNPAFQNPTGARLSPERAQHLVSLAERFGFWIAADDPYIELYLDGDRPLPMPCSNRVLYLGSTSKVIAPGLRIGWLDAHADVIAAVTLAKQATDLQTSTFNQLLVASAMVDYPWWDGHLTALRANYRDRRTAMASALRVHFADAIVTQQYGGFFFWMQLAQPVNVRDLLAEALNAGTAFVPGDAFAIARSLGAPPTGSSIRLSYSNGDPAQFGEALRRLRVAYDKLVGL